ncbi:adenylate/guanylate cyclase domain-containing protein [Geitlerinema sp. CS-897]|nr:adenylate/guanylate cyclase domain-containing protein [Geitlerinema sp. CS-897]
MKRFTIPIGVKIFGVAGSMLALLLGVAYINYRNIALVNRQLVNLAEYLTRLTEDVAQINIDVLEQEIHFERTVRLLETEPIDRRAIDAELAQFEARGRQVDRKLDAAIALAEEAVADTSRLEDVLEIVRIQPLLEVLDADRQNFHDRSLETFDLLQTGDLEAAAILDRQLEQFEENFDRRVRGILFELGAFTEAAARKAERYEREALRVSWVLAAIATALGLGLASAITLGLVRPIRRLVVVTKEVEGGNLQVEVPVASRDEVGQLSASFNAMVAEIQSKERLKATFGQYVDPRIVERLLSSSGREIAPERAEMTVFFSDIAGFSAMSELLTPTGLVALINEYLTLASEPILARNGVIDKFIGDAVEAFWGPPFTSETEHAQLACFAALEQLSQLVKLRRLLPEIMGIRKGLPEIRVRIGLATGEVVAGNIGSKQLKSYTVLGSAVRVAEYLEGANKRYGTTIAIAAATRDAAGDAIETRALDRVVLPGTSETTTIYELLEVAGNLTDRQESLRDEFERGFADYWCQNWDSAQQHFEVCLAIAPDDIPSQLYLDRLRSRCDRTSDR